MRKVKMPRGDSLRILEKKVIEAIISIHGGESADIADIAHAVRDIPVSEWKMDNEVNHFRAWRNCIPRERKYYELFEALNPTIFESVLFRVLTLPIEEILSIEEKMKEVNKGKYESTRALLNLRGDEKEEQVLACCIYLTR